MWMACTNRDTIKIAASLGLGALAFSFLDEAEARTWSGIYYDIIKSDACVPLGHSVNANIAMVSGLLAQRGSGRGRPPRPGGFEFFRYAISALVTDDTVPGRSRLWEEFQESAGAARWLRLTRAPRASPAPSRPRPASARRPTCRTTCAAYEAAGVDQIILLQQAGRNAHADICASLELFASDVLPEFKAKAEGARRPRPRSSRPSSPRRWRARR
jgi:hypothetical protein